MKRRSFVKNSTLLAAAGFVPGQINAASDQYSEKGIYELKVYKFLSGGGINQLKQYYTDAVIPYLNKRDVKVGAFTEYSQENPPKIYILNAYKSPQAYWEAVQDMANDSTFMNAASDYFKATKDQPAYDYYETFLLEAFDYVPQLRVPDKSRGLLELRIYQSPNEQAGRSKIRMFNTGEIQIFEKVGVHPVFFGKIVAGQYMPALIYMTWFTDMKQRDANWSKFSASDEWTEMKSREEFIGNVNHIQRKFLLPADFSQI